MDEGTKKGGEVGRWRRAEMAFCYVVAGVFYLVVIWKAVILSADFDYGKRHGVLPGQRPGWLLGRQIDASDSQWRNFRSNLPVLSALLGLLVTLGELLRKLCPKSMDALTFFWFKCSIFFLLYMHGSCVLFIFFFAGMNYALVKTCAGSRAFPLLLWAYNFAVLLSSRLNNGYSFRHILGAEFAYLDDYRGVFRWEICYNFVMLRMISFGMDFHWKSVHRPSPVDMVEHRKVCEVCSGYSMVNRGGGGGGGGGRGGGRGGGYCYLARQEGAMETSKFSLLTYFCYLFFAPLYVAGPISSYAAFVSHLEARQTAHSQWKLFQYFLRYVACFLLMELITHFTHFNALAVSGVWRDLSPLEVFAIGYGVFNFMWLKFLLIWRFFRFWALVAGFDVPDNMLRCVNNNYDLEGFWRNWHASFNRWIVRYIYIPLGGSESRGTNVWVIFTFVALWHDLEWKLLSWAWMTCVLCMPEVAAKLAMKSTRMKWVRETWMYREACAIAGALNIAGLMGANLVGFVIGADGLQVFGAKIFTRQNIALIGGILLAFYAGTKIMFEIRELESRKRDALKAFIAAAAASAAASAARPLAAATAGAGGGGGQSRAASRGSRKMPGTRTEDEARNDGQGEDHHGKHFRKQEEDEEEEEQQQQQQQQKEEEEKLKRRKRTMFAKSR